MSIWKKVFWIILFFSLFFQIWYSNGINIIPESNTWDKEISEKVENVWKKWWVVMERYNTKAKELDWDVWAQMASGIMNWDTLLNYAIYLVNFLSWIWLLIWACMIIYAWYIYSTSVFTGNASKWTDAIKNAIIGVLIVIFSYAIINVLTHMFL